MASEFEGLTVGELKDLLREQGQPISGKKSVLIQRLEKFESKSTVEKADRLEKAWAWLKQAEEKMYAADMELNNATKANKKEMKEVLDWAQQQLEEAASEVLRAKLGLGEPSE